MHTLENHIEADMSHVEACNQWVKVNGKLTHTNFLSCFVSVLRAIEPTEDNIKALISYFLQNVHVTTCSHCGKIAAYEKDVNGLHLMLCGECQEHVLFQTLGAQEGYV